MNRALARIPKAGRPAEISFRHDRVLFTQSDMHEGNFLLDSNGKMCLIDFDLVGLLPESFVSWTMHWDPESFAGAVAEYLDLPESLNLYSMSRAGGILIMIADRTLGLDEDGNLKST